MENSVEDNSVEDNYFEEDSYFVGDNFVEGNSVVEENYHKLGDADHNSEIWHNLEAEEYRYFAWRLI